MVFLIQNAQNRESKALHLKLDELIDVEHLTEEQLDRLAVRFSKVADNDSHKLKDCIEPRRAEGEKKTGANGPAAGHMTVK